jgi:hypothetical protein
LGLGAPNAANAANAAKLGISISRLQPRDATPLEALIARRSAREVNA